MVDVKPIGGVKAKQESVKLDANAVFGSALKIAEGKGMSVPYSFSVHDAIEGKTQRRGFAVPWSVLVDTVMLQGGLSRADAQKEVDRLFGGWETLDQMGLFDGEGRELSGPIGYKIEGSYISEAEMGAFHVARAEKAQDAAMAGKKADPKQKADELKKLVNEDADATFKSSGLFRK